MVPLFPYVIMVPRRMRSCVLVSGAALVITMLLFVSLQMKHNPARMIAASAAPAPPPAPAKRLADSAEVAKPAAKREALVVPEDSSTKTPAATTKALGTAAVTSFDCEAGYPNFKGGKWHEKWSGDKKAYCCKHYGRGCPRVTSLPFDCMSGCKHWLKGWSEAKKTWCCQHENCGCAPTSMPFDCDAGYDNWAADWSSSKKAYCCQHAGRACEANE